MQAALFTFRAYAVLGGQVDSLKFLLANGLDYNKARLGKDVKELGVASIVPTILELLPKPPRLS